MILLYVLLILGVLGALLWPFVKGATGLETLDALEWFEANSGALLCFSVCAIRFDYTTGAIAALALVSRVWPRQKPRIIFKQCVFLLCLDVIWLQWEAWQ